MLDLVHVLVGMSKKFFSLCTVSVEVIVLFRYICDSNLFKLHNIITTLTTSAVQLWIIVVLSQYLILFPGGWEDHQTGFI